MQIVLQVQHGSLQLGLTDRDGEVAACLFENAARSVGGAAQSAGDGVGIIDGDEQSIDVVHMAQQNLAPVIVALSQLVQDIAAQLSYRFSQAIEIRCPVDGKITRQGKR